MDRKEWINQASNFFANYAYHKAQGYTFLAEDVKAFAQETGFPEPNDPRNWGVAARKARSDGRVHVVGFAAARTSNGSPKCLWRAYG
jgi:hypothetical protein